MSVPLVRKEGTAETETDLHHRDCSINEALLKFKCAQESREGDMPGPAVRMSQRNSRARSCCCILHRSVSNSVSVNDVQEEEEEETTDKCIKAYKSTIPTSSIVLVVVTRNCTRTRNL